MRLRLRLIVAGACLGLAALWGFGFFRGLSDCRAGAGYTSALARDNFIGEVPGLGLPVAGPVIMAGFRTAVKGACRP